MPGFSDQDSSQDCRRPHSTAAGDFVTNKEKWKIEMKTKSERGPWGNLCDRELAHDPDQKGHQGRHHRHFQPGHLMSSSA